MHLKLLFIVCTGIIYVESLPDQGIWDFSITQVSNSDLMGMP